MTLSDDEGTKARRETGPDRPAYLLFSVEIQTETDERTEIS